MHIWPSTAVESPSSFAITKKDLGYFIRLGGFHTRMCFFGCIGCVMSNSGMEDALELIYAENTVPR